VTYEVEGSAAELAAAPGLPAAAGWTLDSETVSAAEPGSGEAEKITRVWTRQLADLNSYPETFHAAGEDAPAWAPRSETSLLMEEQPGRTIYTFTRRYLGRRAGKFAELEKMAGNGEILQRAREDGFAGLSPDERDALFMALAEYEAAAMWLRVRDALGRGVLEGVIDTGAYNAGASRVEQFLQERLTGSYLQRYFALDEAAQDRELDLLRQDLRQEVMRLLPPSRSGRLVELLAEEEQRFQATQDLGDDGFSLEVQLPGTVVAGNALELDGGSALWTFDGSALSEGDLVLTAISVLEHGAAR